MATTSHNRVSLATARFIPPFLALIVAYASYVVVGPLSINYLIKERQQVAPGIAIPIVHFILLIPVAATWLRLLITVWREPGYVPSGLKFIRKEVFVCDSSGKPIFCQICEAYKPDRTHHNQDVGRCTRKMDHFCPWVGGVVGERSMKYFLQFMLYAAVLTLYLTTLFAYFVARHKRVQWIVVLGVASFFLLFTLGMLLNSLHLAFQNLTTIEHAGSDRRMYLAVILPPDMHGNESSAPDSSLSEAETEVPFTSELDDPSHQEYFSRQNPVSRRSVKSLKAPKIWKSIVNVPSEISYQDAQNDLPQTPNDNGQQASSDLRAYAILEVPVGLNPWDLGTAWRNFTAMFGSHLHEWLIPLKPSPCCFHDSLISEYPLGPQFESLLATAGLTESPAQQEVSPSESRRRRRRLDTGWQNGERPDGWISQKEARRLRNEWKRRAREDEEPSLND